MMCGDQNAKTPLLYLCKKAGDDKGMVQLLIDKRALGAATGNKVLRGGVYNNFAYH